MSEFIADRAKSLFDAVLLAVLGSLLLFFAHLLGFEPEMWALDRLVIAPSMAVQLGAFVASLALLFSIVFFGSLLLQPKTPNFGYSARSTGGWGTAVRVALLLLTLTGFLLIGYKLIAGWHLTNTQTQKISAAIAAHPDQVRRPFAVFPVAGSPDAEDMAADIFRVFGQNNWPVILATDREFAKRERGLIIAVRPGTTVADNPTASAIKKILEAAGFVVVARTHTQLHPNLAAALIVGQRPWF